MVDYSSYPNSYIPSRTSDNTPDSNGDNPNLINEFDSRRDPLWYILRKAEISFEKTRLASENMRDNKWALANIREM